MIADRIKTFKRVNVADLIDNPKNWRKHPDAQRNALGGLLESVGWADAVLARETDEGLMLIDGHLRKELAADSKVPVLVLDVTEAEADLILATHDPLTSMAETDQALLDELVQGLEIDNDETQKMLDELASDPVIEVVEDEVPEVPEEPTTKVGDLFELGDHRLLCGDCTSADNVARLMDGAKADAVVTDPPYGMRLDADFSSMKNNLQITKDKSLKGGTKYENVIGDHDDFDASAVIKTLDNTISQFWFGADYYASTLGDTEHSGSWLVWDKRLDDSADKMFGSCFELIWSKQKCKRDILRIKWAGIFGMEKEHDRGRKHPNQKPTELFVNLISRTTGIVYDPFLGSGTTLIAAEQLGRKCYGMEISPAYCDVIIQRWENLTGKKAKKVK
jgi:DNA modification methylase